ncbi:similar to Saccharomyces cerevisiae YIL106W MOB1 Component of the mitotic exit network [Maudiozyma barnettii]|uniref:Similar to Saccharomyces cerevisiae YIL106W MOB1 Component of the mitotic exit network n=1 Tax=Maudiozyma barnettii TaxID=61262 RepID=A0A8H2ZF44_9SACH|nr:Mob1p [Kazachstania barnettii]CAB4252866.1 similar to Saccharomyces cerevisiae YIL106W MOB1 Component of the mitotic exit network [Kazachstania barnettii]CAD1780661.1 similar to Saccharomyces cerevisiae YIL106W MOB1 Component of the mitotic exit network [Kazachstania barnettii]
MSFLQNFHLSPGQTIRSTRGFKWNTGNNDQPQDQSQLNGQGSPLVNKGQSEYNSNSNFMTTPVKQRGGNNTSLFNAPLDQQQQQQVTDFNYTPSHQKPFIQPVSGTTVTTHQDIKEIVETTLGSEGVLNQAVKLPKGENENEWLAVHVVDFYNQINMLYGTITEFCSPESCPRMIATNEYEYLWSFEKGRSPVSVSAPKYVECLMRWCQDQFDDELIFPSRRDGVFPDRFIDKVIIPMLRRLFRVYAHIYCHHFNEVLELNLQTVLNTSFRHFCLFAQEFNLLRPSDFGPLLELVTELRDR